MQLIFRLIPLSLAASYATHEETGPIGVYLQSSRTAKADFTKFLPTIPRLEFFLGNMIKAIYELENETYMLDPIDIIYFEDFIKPNTTYNKINFRPFFVNCTKVQGNDIAIKEWQQKRNCGQGAKKYLRYLFTLAKVDMAKKIHRVFPSIVSSLGKCFLLNSFPHFFTNSERKKGKL